MWFYIAVFAVVLAIAGGRKASQLGLFAFVGKKPIAISAAVSGAEVTLKGTVEVLETISAPFSQRPCAAYELKIDREHTSGFGDSRTRTWVPVTSDLASRDFIVVDADGNRAFVDGSMLKLYLKPDQRGQSGTFFSDSKVIAFLNSRGITTGGSWGAKKFRVLEGVLEAGEKVTVHGIAHWEADPDAEMEVSGYRTAERPQRLRIIGGDDGTVVVRDR